MPSAIAMIAMAKAELADEDFARLHIPSLQQFVLLMAEAIPANYLTDTTRPWSDKKDQTKRRFKAFYPKTEAGGIAVAL